MSCAACQHHVEAAVRALPGVSAVGVSLITATMTVTHTCDPAAISAAVERAGYSATPREAGAPALPEQGVSTRADILRVSLLLLLAVAVFLLAMGPMLSLPRPAFLDPALGHGARLILAELILTLPAVYLGRRYFIRGTAALLRRAPTMDTLVALGAGAALLHGVALFVLALITPARAAEYAGAVSLEAVTMILAFVSVGKLLEGRARDKTADALRALAALAPKRATVLRGGQEVEIDTAALCIGDLCVLRTGESAPADGEVTEGFGTMNEAMLTGESLPIDKHSGAPVVAGCLLTDGRILFRVTAVGEDTALADMIRTVSAAAASEAPIARIADRVSAVFVPTVAALALLTLLLQLLITRDISLSLGYAISVLVISCPCALGLATPTAIMAATGTAARLGILVKSAAALEGLGRIDTVALDKTGTLTRGEMTVSEVVALPDTDAATLLSAAAACEAASTHPLAVAIRAEAERRELTLPTAEGFLTVEGHGIAADIGPDRWFAGNAALLEEDVGLDLTPLSEATARLTAKGCSLVYVAREETLCGVIGISDTPRDEARAAVADLCAMGITPLMLTGDNPAAAKTVGTAVGIDEIHAALTPEGKSECIKACRAKGARVAMVGDGTNDALPLVTADLGIAIGAGTDIAIASADVVLRRGGPRDAVTALAIGRRTVRIIRQNLFWALVYNSVCIPIAAGVLAPLGLVLTPGISAAAMSLSSLFVVTNSLRLLRHKQKETA